MGWLPTLRVGLHYPDLFGGIGAGDPAMWGRTKPQIAIQTIPKLYPNARNVDVFFKNAVAGIQRQSTESADGIVAQGGFATTEVFPRMPHSFGDQISLCQLRDRSDRASDPPQACRGQILHEYAALQSRLLGYHRPADAP